MKLISNDAVRNYIAVREEQVKRYLLGIEEPKEESALRFKCATQLAEINMRQLAHRNIDSPMPINFNTVDGMAYCYLLGLIDAERIIVQELERRELERLFGPEEKENDKQDDQISGDDVRS